MVINMEWKSFFIWTFLSWLKLSVYSKNKNKAVVTKIYIKKSNSDFFYIYSLAALDHYLVHFLITRFELWWNFGRPTWSLACGKNIFICMKSKNSKKYLILKLKNNFQNMFRFYDSFNVLWVKKIYWCSLWWHLPRKKYEDFWSHFYKFDAEI